MFFKRRLVAFKGGFVGMSVGPSVGLSSKNFSKIFEKFDKEKKLFPLSETVSKELKNRLKCGNIIKHESLLKWARRKINVDMLLNAVKHHVVSCNVCRLKCVDPPAVSTGQLYDLGYSQYDVRTFWAKLPLGEHKLTLYRLKAGEFQLVFEHSIGKVNEVYCGNVRVPIDEFDASRRESIFTPNSHRLYIRLSGQLGGNKIRVNIIRFAKLVESYELGLADKVIDTVNDIVWGRKDKSEVFEIIYRELERWKNIVSLILPHFPADRNHLRELMPLFRT
jgi:hypothetical protein